MKRTKTATDLSKFFLGLVLAVFLGGCSSSSKLSFKNKKIKRSWVRRLAPEAELQSNEFSQTSSPIVTEGGNIIQGSSFGGISEFTFYGRKVWSLEDEISNIVGSQSVYKNFLFFGTEDKKIHAFNRNDKKIIWSTQLQSAVSAVSDFGNGNLYVLTTKGQAYALNAADGVIKWTKYIPSRKSLVIHGGPKPVLYKDQVLMAFPNGSVVSFAQASGKVKWSVGLPGSQKFEDADFMMLRPEGDFYVGVYDEAIYKINPDTGSIKWQAFEKPVGKPGFHLNKLYFASKEGELAILQAGSGKLVQKTKFFKGIGGRPVFINDSMIVADSKGPVVAYESSSLEKIDSYDLISPVSSDIVANKAGTKFYLMSDKGYLFSLGLR